MRSFDEINADLTEAVLFEDVSAMRALAEELQTLHAPQAEVARLNAFGTVSRVTGDYPKALEHFRHALALCGDLGDHTGVAKVTSNIGNVYLDTGDYPKALEYYRHALAAGEELDDRAVVANVVGNIGNVYGLTGDFRQALEYHQRALAGHEELGNRGNVAIAAGNLGNVYYHIGDCSQALQHYQRALAEHEELGDGAGVAFIMADMTTLLLAMNRNEEAAALLQKQSSMKIDKPGLRAQYHSNHANLAERREDLDTARDQLHEALDIVTEAGAQDEVAEIHRLLRDLAKKRNDFDGYVKHNDEYLRVIEKIKGKQATQQMAIMEAERNAEAVEREREKERALLYGALPKSVATRMLRGESVTGDHFDTVSVIFLDIVKFTELSDRIPPGHVVYLLEQIFTALDDVCEEHGLTKIKTIGDSYMAVAGVPEPLDDHQERGAKAALAMLTELSALELTMPEELGDTSWIRGAGDIEVRIGVHCGPVTAGVIGKQRLQYDVWGDTVNVASRMESTSETGRIQVSAQFAKSLGGIEGTGRDWKVEERGGVEVKGKGSMQTYWLEGA